jgi:hypothetical protein
MLFLSSAVVPKEVDRGEQGGDPLSVMGRPNIAFFCGDWLPVNLLLQVDKPSLRKCDLRKPERNPVNFQGVPLEMGYTMQHHLFTSTSWMRTRNLAFRLQ